MAEPQLLLKNSMREKMLRNEIASTLSIKLVRSVELPMMAKTAGFDGVLIDMEHSSFDLDTTGQICMAALYANITPIVRAPSKEPFFVSRILDGGALGVIVPHIRSVQDAKDVVAAVSSLSAVPSPLLTQKGQVSACRTPLIDKWTAALPVPIDSSESSESSGQRQYPRDPYDRDFGSIGLC